MHLNHLNLCSSDVSALTDTLEQHFGYQVVQAGRVPDLPGVPNAGTDFAFLLGQDESYIVISQIDPHPHDQSSYPPQFHFGLMQDSADAVHAKHAELTAAGYHPGEVSEGFEVFGAEWTAFYCTIGDGLEIEVNHRTHSTILDRHQSRRPAPGPLRTEVSHEP